MKNPFQTRFFRNSKTVLTLGCLLVGIPIISGGCPAPQSSDDFIIVELTWDQIADLDIHVWQTPSTQCSNTECSLDKFSISDDVTDGTGPETVTMMYGIPDGRYRIAANFHEIKPPALHGSRTATIKVSYKVNNEWNVVTYGPYTFTTEIGSEGYPVTGNTESWWRPVDIEKIGDTVTLLPADSTPLTK